MTGRMAGRHRTTCSGIRPPPLLAEAPFSITRGNPLWVLVAYLLEQASSTLS